MYKKTTLTPMPDTYVACAMSALPPEEYEKLRFAVLDVCAAIREIGRTPYSEPFEITGDQFETPAQAIEKNFKVLDAATALVLIFTHKETTSALIELGYALHRRIPIVVFAKNDVKLPFYLREPQGVMNTVHVVPFNTYEELASLARSELSSVLH